LAFFNTLPGERIFAETLYPSPPGERIFTGTFQPFLQEEGTFLLEGN